MSKQYHSIQSECMLGERDNLLITVCGFAFGRDFTTALDTKHYSSNIAKSVKRSTKPRLTQNRCACCTTRSQYKYNTL